jgi:CHAT domain-containing protein
MQTSDPTVLAEQLLACFENDWDTWLDAHHEYLSLALVSALKAQSDTLNRADPPAALRMCRAAHAVASRIAHEPLAFPLAQWAMGNVTVYTQPTEAVVCYHDALNGYSPTGDVEAVARISSNLVFAYTNLGKITEALHLAARARDLLTSLGPSGEWYLIRFGMNYGWLLFEHGDYQEALRVNEASMTLALKYEEYIDWAQLQVNQAFTLGMVGRIAESEELLLDSREILVQHHQALTVARVDLNLADLYGALGRLSKALQHFRLARAGFESLQVVMESATVLMFEAELLVRLNALRQARQAYTQARSRFATEAMQHYVAQTLLAEAAVRHRIDVEDRQIIRLLAEAGVLFKQCNLPLALVEVDLEYASLGFDREDLLRVSTILAQPLPEGVTPTIRVRHMILQGMLELRQGAIVQAIGSFSEALSLAKESTLIWWQREAHAYLGRCLIADDRRSAIEHLEAACQIDEAMRAELQVEELTASFQTRRNAVLPLLITTAIDAGDSGTALRHTWRHSGGALLDLMAAYAVRDKVVQSDNEQLELLRQQRNTLRWHLAQATQEEGPEVINRLQAQVNSLEQQILELRRVMRQGEGGKAFRLPSDPSVVLAQLDADLLIEFVVCEQELFAFCASRDGRCETTRLGSVQILVELLNRLTLRNLNFLRLKPPQRAQHQERLVRDVQKVLQHIHAFLVAPLHLPSSSKLLIAPCAPLHLVPFAALWDGQAYLVTQHEIELIPSGALLIAPPPPAGPVSAPLVIGSSTEGTLDSVATEIQVVAEALSESVSYLDEPEALNYLVGLRTAPRILHISAHSEIDPEPSIFSSLQLAGSMLTIEHCYDLTLNGNELVVLSGCTTATGIESGGALLAFQSALLVAGAKRVLSSLWQIKDDLAATMMTTFYTHLVSGMSPVDALRAAQLDLLSDPETAHPAAWAAFALTRR